MKTLKFIFSSLFSNEKIINESKKQPWWLAIVLILFSCVIALIPNFVSVMTVQGSNVISVPADANYAVRLLSPILFRCRPQPPAIRIFR